MAWSENQEQPRGLGELVLSVEIWSTPYHSLREWLHFQKCLANVWSYALICAQSMGIFPRAYTRRKKVDHDCCGIRSKREMSIGSSTPGGRIDIFCADECTRFAPEATSALVQVHGDTRLPNIILTQRLSREQEISNKRKILESGTEQHCSPVCAWLDYCHQLRPIKPAFFVYLHRKVECSERRALLHVRLPIPTYGPGSPMPACQPSAYAPHIASSSSWPIRVLLAT